MEVTENYFRNCVLVAETVNEHVMNSLILTPPSLKARAETYVREWSASGKTQGTCRDCRHQNDCDWIITSHIKSMPSIISAEPVYFRIELHSSADKQGRYFMYPDRIVFSKTDDHPLKTFFQDIFDDLQTRFNFSDDVIYKMFQKVQTDFWALSNNLHFLLVKIIEESGDEDLAYLFRVGQNLASHLKTSNDANKRYNEVLRKAKADLLSIIEGLNASKSFTKSKVLKDLRERAERVCADIQGITP